MNAHVIDILSKLYDAVYINPPTFLAYTHIARQANVNSNLVDLTVDITKYTQMTKFMEPTWGPPGSCRPQMGPMSASWTLLSGYSIIKRIHT